MHDFHCRNAKDIRNECLARRMEKLKNSETEVSRMCEAMENYGEECREEGKLFAYLTNIRALIKKQGLSVDEAFDIFDIPESDRATLRKQLV